jgi:hypothetical protein
MLLVATDDAEPLHWGVLLGLDLRGNLGLRLSKGSLTIVVLWGIEHVLEVLPLGVPAGRSPIIAAIDSGCDAVGLFG